MRSAAALFLLAGLFGWGNDNIDFDRVAIGAMPPFWTAAETHTGPPPQWKIVPEKTAPSRKNVFAQVSTSGHESEYPLAVYDKVLCKDGDLSVKFKITGGRHARSAGIVWRYQDPGNYYLLEFSADQREIGLFHVRDGETRPVPVTAGKSRVTSVAHDIREGQWYVAKVSYRGSRVRVTFGNRLLFEAVDESLKREGKTGLWTKAGTVAEFDDFRIDKKG